MNALRMQIPAFLCRQTDLIVAAAKTGAIIQIKKGQFCAASVMRNSAEKCRAAGKGPLLCYRTRRCVLWSSTILFFPLDQGQKFVLGRLIPSQCMQPACAV